MFLGTGDGTVYKIKVPGNLTLFQGFRIFISYSKEMRTSEGGWNRNDSYPDIKFSKITREKKATNSFLRDQSVSFSFFSISPTIAPPIFQGDSLPLYSLPQRLSPGKN